MKNLIICVAILLAGLGAGAQNSLVTHIAATCPPSGADVTELSDHSILIRYTQNDIRYRAFYDKNGTWLHTVASYGGTSLPASVRGLIKTSWYNWNITYVDEVQTPGLSPVYRVQLKRNGRLVILRVSDEEMATEEELRD